MKTTTMTSTRQTTTYEIRRVILPFLPCLVARDYYHPDDAVLVVPSMLPLWILVVVLASWQGAGGGNNRWYVGGSWLSAWSYEWIHTLTNEQTLLAMFFLFVSVGNQSKRFEIVPLLHKERDGIHHMVPHKTIVHRRSFLMVLPNDVCPSFQHVRHYTYHIAILELET